MSKNVFAELGSSTSLPVDKILSQDFVDGLNKAGSLFSMIENKKLNPTALFGLILETPSYQDFFVELTSSENFKDAILSMLYLYPSIVKSKITKTTIRRINAKQLNRTRKAAV
jgi:hypothetical protein